MCFIIIYPRPSEASLAAGRCGAQPLNLASFYLFRAATCWMVCPDAVFSRRSLGTCWEKRGGLTWGGEWASFHLCHPHHTSASLPLFEASLIPAFGIKKGGWKVIERQKGDILGGNKLLWNMLRISIALTHNAASEGKFAWHFFPDRGLATGFAWIGEGLFEVTDVSGTGVLWNLHERPKNNRPPIVNYSVKNVALSQHVWSGVRRNLVIFRRRSHLT